MNALIVLFAVVAVASAGHIATPGTFYTRAPAFDSAVIKSDRLGGNFAYSTVESHAFAQHSPVVQHVTSPVAVSYSSPALATYAAPAPVASYAAAAPFAHNAYNAYPYSFNPYHAAAPVAYSSGYVYRK